MVLIVTALTMWASPSSGIPDQVSAGIPPAGDMLALTDTASGIPDITTHREIIASQHHHAVVLEVRKAHLLAKRKARERARARQIAAAAVVTAQQAPAAGAPPAPPAPTGDPQSYALSRLGSYEYGCLDNIATRESGWRYNAENASGAYGIPQALPGSKMSSMGADWATNPITQVRWMIVYVDSKYGSACAAWGFWEAHSWY